MRPQWLIMSLCLAAVCVAAPADQSIPAHATWQQAVQFTPNPANSATPAEFFVPVVRPTAVRGERGREPLDDNLGQWFTWTGSMAIPDAQCPAITAAALQVAAAGYVVDVEVTITNLVHTYDSDLNIYLTGPNGARTSLCLRRGGSGDNFVNTVFDDDAEQSIATGSAPFTNEYIPETPLTAPYYGIMAAGTWNLEICDAAGQDLGVLYGWRLQLLLADCWPPPWNDDCWNVPSVSLPATFYGTTDCATANDCPAFAGFPRNVWIAFTTTQTCDLLLKFCGSAMVYGNAWLNLTSDCSCSWISQPGTWERDVCADGNLTIYWQDVPAGTYHYPVLYDPAGGAQGPYVITVSCEQFSRCCYGNPPGVWCQNRTEGDCELLGGVWSEGLDCRYEACTQPVYCQPYAHFSQLPTPPEGAWTFHTSEDAADYTCFEHLTTPFIMKKLRFWGVLAAYNGGWQVCSESPPSFLVQVHADNAGLPGNVWYSASVMPTVSSGNPYSITDPPSPVYQFDVELGAAAIADDSWISVTGQGDPTCNFLWLNSPTGGGNAQQQGPDGEWYWTGTNLAVCIEGGDCVPEATQCPGRVVPSLPFGEIGNTACATNSIDQCAYPGFSTPYNVYVYTAPVCETVTVNLCGSVYDTQLEVRVGSACPGSTRVACNDDNGVCGGNNLQSYLSFTAVAGNTYYIVIGGYMGATGAYSLSMYSTPFTAPNDICPGTSITSLPFTSTGDTRCAIDNYPWSCSTLDGPDVMYTLTLPTCQRVTASLCGAEFDTGIEVRTGGACPGSSLVICNDDNFCDGEYVVQSEVTFDAQAGVTYYLAIEGYNGAAGPFYLGIVGVPCPVLNPPTELVAQRSGQNIRLNWRRATGATMYKVFRGTTKGFVPDGSTYVATVTDTVWLDMNIVSNPATLYFYAVTSVNSALLAAELPAEKATLQSESRVPLDLYRISNEESAQPEKAKPE